MLSHQLTARLRAAAFIATAAAASMIGPASDAHAQTWAAHLNIVVIMADDLDVQSLQAAIDNGPPDQDSFMPNLKSFIVNGGSSFVNSFVTESLCCPSRSTFLTGLYPHNHGVVRNVGENGGFAKFEQAFQGSAPLPAWLQSANYRTAHVGKYLNGYVDYTVVPRGWTEWRALIDPSTYCMYNYQISKNGKELLDYGADPSEPATEYQTDVLTGLADEIIRAPDPRPLFLSIAPLAPHVEVCKSNGTVNNGIRPAPRHVGTVNLPLPQPPSFNEDDMSDKPAWMHRLPLQDASALQTLYNDRIAALRAIDDLIGTVGTALRDTGRLNQTVFIFTSDNGYLLGQHRWASKILLYEESIRVPLIVRIPAIAGPQAIPQFALNNDLAPTIAALANVRPSYAVDGVSLLPLIEGQQTPWRKRFLVEVSPATDAADESPDNDASRTLFQPAGFFAIRTRTAGMSGRPAGVVYAETVNDRNAVIAVELYDLALDTFQLRSLHDDTSPPRVMQRQQLKRDLNALKSCANGTCQTIEAQ